MSVTLDDELRVATEAAIEAAHAILAVETRARQNVSQKDRDQGPVTEADLAADEIIRKHLSAAFPDDTLVTEETYVHGTKVPQHPRVWYIDPLDGTREFVKGNGDYVVQVGLCLDGVATLGVLVHPPTMTVWRGVPGRSERSDPKNSDAFVEIKIDDQLDKKRVVTSRSHPSKRTDRVISELGATLIHRGSVGLKVAMLLDGEAEVYVSGSSRMKLWDTAAPVAVLNAGGGKMTTLLGEELVHNKEMTHLDGVWASSPAFFDANHHILTQTIQSYEAETQGDA